MGCMQSKDFGPTNTEKSGLTTSATGETPQELTKEQKKELKRQKARERAAQRNREQLAYSRPSVAGASGGAGAINPLRCFGCY
jgi:hypothetical protein